MKKGKILMAVFMAFVMIFAIKSINTEVFGIEYHNPDNWLIPSDYAFRAHMSSNPSIQRFPSTGWTRIPSFSEGQDYKNESAVSKGNVGARYANIGTYNGHQLDMIMTYTDWSSPHFISVNGIEAGGGYAVWGSERNSNKWILVEVSFRDHYTNEPVWVKGHELIWDIDQSDRKSVV